jgi:hypothetical protein
LERRPEPERPSPRGQARPGPRDILSELWLALGSKSPAADWTRYRVLAMLLTTVLLVWTLGRVVSLAQADSQGGVLAQPAVAAAEADPSGAGTVAAEGRTAGGQLRSDLFKVPRRPKPGPPPEPKTNPLELLELIELQGVLGGANPKAMIQYKRTRESVTVSVGDDLGEFKVMEIRSGSVVLKWRNELFELSL